jgi:hypothetical protein
MRAGLSLKSENTRFPKKWYLAVMPDRVASVACRARLLGGGCAPAGHRAGGPGLSGAQSGPGRREPARAPGGAVLFEGIVRLMACRSPVLDVVPLVRWMWYHWSPPNVKPLSCPPSLRKELSLPQESIMK